MNGTFARFPAPMPESFALDVVKGLEGYTLVPGRYRDVDRFVLRAPKGKVLKPNPKKRQVRCAIGGKMHYFNVTNLLA
ncbi:MAG: hypothetical protein ACO22A_08540, partial [Schleiferiaceae bacterium]